VSTPPPSARGFDPEAEQEVDFAKYVRLLAVRWWLLAAGLVLGAIIGYIVSLGGGAQVYSATATIYLGQPYSVGGNTQVFGLQTTPSAVGQIIHSQVVDTFVARTCNTKESAFRNGISSAAVSGSSSGNSTSKSANLLTTISVQTRKARDAECVANNLAKLAITRLGTFPRGKIANLEAEIAADKAAIAAIDQGLSNPSISPTDKLLVQTNLRTNQLDQITASQLLLQAKEIESPSLVTGAAAQKVTARSRRNTVVVAAVIGLILGALAALLWDAVVPRFTSSA
jgi:capsular polysaccharide biosynthesis protein